MCVSSGGERKQIGTRRTNRRNNYRVQSGPLERSGLISYGLHAVGCQQIFFLNLQPEEYRDDLQKASFMFSGVSRIIFVFFNFQL